MATSTTKEKAHSLGVENLKKNWSLDGLKLSGGEVFCKREYEVVGDVVCKSLVVPMGTKVSLQLVHMVYH
jgi:hypothetical protein